jgi:ferredoxin
MLALGFWKGRFFCRWICPTGTIYALPSRWNADRKLLKQRICGYLFWIILFASLAGVPLILFLDPLATFNRLTPLLKGTFTWSTLALGLLVPLMLLLGAFQPMIWCTHICPLGYLLQFCGSLRRAGVKKSFDGSRRQIAFGVFIGLPAGIAARKFLFTDNARSRSPVLPPGAKDTSTFSATCSRCYACVNACPTGIIAAGSVSHQRLDELFQPEIRYFDDAERPDEGFCIESCTNCSQVCPTVALTPLTLRQKRQRKTGTAEIIRDKCLAWNDNEHCMVCQEYCSYAAIDSDVDQNDLPRPVVNEDICRGCGVCEHICPAEEKGKAILVRGVREQTHIDDGYADLFED